MNTTTDELVAIKKELKCWESMFARKYDRKPTQDDVSNSSEEIKDSYKRYASLKKQQKTEKNLSTTSLVAKTNTEINNAENDDGVFGSNLNKSKTLTAKKDEQVHYAKFETSSWRPKLNVKKICLKVNNNGKVEKKENIEDIAMNDININNDSNFVNGNFQVENGAINTSVTDARAVTRLGKKSSFNGRRKSTFSKFTSLSQDVLNDSMKALQEKKEETEKAHVATESKKSDENLTKETSGEKHVISNSLTSTNTIKELTTKSYTIAELSQDRHLETTDKTKTVVSIGLNSNNINTKKFENDIILTSGKTTSKIEEGHQRNADLVLRQPSSGINKEKETGEIHDSDSTTDVKKPLKTKGKRKRTKDDKNEEDHIDEKSKRVKISKKAAEKGKRLEECGISQGMGAILDVDVKIRLVSDNFVKIDMRKKTYVRGLKKLTGAQYKRQQWRKKTNFERPTKASLTKTCFKCGGEGHWAKFCRGRPKQVNPFSKLDDEKASMEFQHLSAEKGSCFNYMDDQGNSVGNNEDNLHAFSQKNKLSMDDVLDIKPCWPRQPYKQELEISESEPLFPVDSHEPSKNAYSKVETTLKLFGYDGFREGQREATARIVSGLSTLVILSTGSGKSLCYQLPAYMYYKERQAMTIVVSPLVALMQDQIAGLPSCLPGAFLNSNMTKLQQQKVVTKIKAGQIAVLLVSPEALVSGGFSTGLLPPKAALPPIAFACIDEAHCLSEWSHNFRPSYLKVCRVLRERYNIKCLLGLTATASQTTAKSVTQHLGIPSDGSIIRSPSPIPLNLQITASRDENRDMALVELLQMVPFSECDSIIIYVTRRTEADRLAVLLRTSLPDRPAKKKTKEEDEDKEVKGKKKTKSKTKSNYEKNIKPHWWNVESYHAGLTPAQRRRVQNQFMSNELRVVVATVAFGMGLDKSDVRSVIHFNMPKSFENYVQEIGRAGRDGKPSFCHAFLDDDGNDMNELRRHIYGNTIDRSTVKTFIDLVFPNCKCNELREKHKLIESNNDDFEMSKQPLTQDEIDMLFSQEVDDVMLSQGVSSVDETDIARKESSPSEGDTIVGKEVDSIEAKEVSKIPNDIVYENEVNEQLKDDAESSEVAFQATSELSEFTSGEPTSEPKYCDKTMDLAKQEAIDNSIHFDTDSIHSENYISDRPTSPSYCSERPTLPNDYSDQTTLNCCSGHRVGVAIDSAVNILDMREENISTLLSYLELHPKRWLEVLNPIRNACCVKCYGGPQQFQLLAKKFPPVAIALRQLDFDEKFIHEMRQIDFELIEIADVMCWDVLTVAREVRSLQWNMSFALDAPLNTTGKSGIIVENEHLSFHLITKANITDDERDEICDFLHENVLKQERTRLLQLNALYNVLDNLSCKHYYELETKKRVDEKAREEIARYFLYEEEGQLQVLEDLCKDDTKLETSARRWNVLAGDIRSLLISHPDQDFSGRAVAKIFQGIDSPCYPALTYGRDRRFWRQALDIDFNELREFAVKEISRFRS